MAQPHIIPEPTTITKIDDAPFVFSKETTITADDSCIREGRFLSEIFATPAGFTPPVNQRENPKSSVKLTCDASLLKDLGEEGYRLSVTANKITMWAARPTGIFYACQTLRQTLPPEIDGIYPVENLDMSIPCVDIEDRPRFQYRGYMLDVSRYFIPMDTIKKLIDTMAFYKMNTFHWHLTDYQGWRLQIKKHPKLTLIGSQQKQSGIMYHGKTVIHDRTPNGGFYTHDQVHDLIAYAAARHITIIPEIDVPAHSIAAIAAYPELSCEGKPVAVQQDKWGGQSTVFCPGKEETFSFLEDVLGEVFELFPESRIHVGGDEVNKEKWKKCPHCQERMTTEKLDTFEELQSYFITRIEAFANEKGHTIIGWDEILEGGLAPNAIVMSWRGTEGGVKAAKMGHKVIMTPTSHCYFDYVQANDREDEPFVKFDAYLPVSKVYSYEPIPPELTKEQGDLVLGAQANMWSNFITSPSHVEYMTFPRLLALSEVVWSQESAKDYKRFKRKLLHHFPRLEQRHVAFRNKPIE